MAKRHDSLGHTRRHPHRPSTRSGTIACSGRSAQADDQGANAEALRRIALLSEVWDCLRSEPGQAEAATELAVFCEEAIVHLARDQPADTSNAFESAQWVLRQSDERWSDYLALVRSRQPY